MQEKAQEAPKAEGAKAFGEERRPKAGEGLQHKACTALIRLVLNLSGTSFPVRMLFVGWLRVLRLLRVLTCRSCPPRAPQPR